jgi:hypothetical protein
MTEDGFTAVYRSLRTAQDSEAASAVTSIGNYLSNGTAATVTICGHSLGGALATLLVADVAANTACRTPVAYTYASPRVGDHIFASSFNALVGTSYRIENRQDLVPKLPPVLPLPYEHTNTQFELNPPPNAVQPTIACMHHLTSYLWLMGQLAGQNTGPLDPDCIGTPPTP